MTPQVGYLIRRTFTKAWLEADEHHRQRVDYVWPGESYYARLKVDPCSYVHIGFRTKEEAIAALKDHMQRVKEYGEPEWLDPYEYRLVKITTTEEEICDCRQLLRQVG